MAPPRKISEEAIVACALDLLKRNGLDAVTQRSVAQELGVEAASLYRHVAGKGQLRALMALSLYKEQIDQVGQPPTWQSWLADFGQILWATQREIPDCARLVLTTEFHAQDYASMSCWASAPLITYGIELEVAEKMPMSVQALVLGLAGLADGPNAGQIRQTIDLDQVMEQSLQALIFGWAAAISG